MLHNCWQAGVALTGALSQLVSPLALNKITDYMDTHDPDVDGDGVPLVVVLSVAGLFLGQVLTHHDTITVQAVISYQ